MPAPFSPCQTVPPATPLPVGTNAPAPINRVVLCANPLIRHQQANLAAANIGTPTVYPVGNRTRNPDQIDVIDQMKYQQMKGMQHMVDSVGGLQPSPDVRRWIQLEGAITSSLERMQRMTANGHSTANITARIAKLQQEHVWFLENE